MSDDEELRGELVPLAGDPGRVGDLKPIPEHVVPPCGELAVALRGLFGAVGVSLRVFALRVYRDPGTVSRYLNGTVVAPAEFVDTLLTHAAKATGRPSSPEVIAHVHGLQRRALQATNRTGWELQNLRDQLADADRQRQHAEVRAEALTEALQARKQRIAEMEIEQRQLAVSMSVERDGRGGRDGRGAEVELLRDERERLRGERDRLKEEVARLQGELDQARRQALEAERRCEELEHQLQAGEEAAAEQAEDPVAHRLWLAEEQASAAEERARRLEWELDRMRGEEGGRGSSASSSGDRVVRGHHGDLVHVATPSPPGLPGGLPGHLPVTVTYAGPNRPWAAWVAQRLEATGVAREEITVRRWDPAAAPSLDLERAMADLLGDDAFHLLLLSEHFFALGSARTEAEWEAVLGSAAVRQRADRIAAFVVSGHPLPVVVARLGAVGLLGVDEEECERRLLRALSVSGVPARANGGRQRSRLPGDPPELWDGVPRRNPRFTGRDLLLERINDSLRDAPAEAAVCALVGLPGIGKTQLATEYAYRFGAEYDVVWWAAADERGVLEERLGGNLPHLGEDVQGYSAAARAGAALDSLRRGVPSDRWLLVLDGADAPEAVADLLPGGRGHVLITSQNRGWADHYVGLLEVPPFSRDESVAFVRARAPRLGRAQADALAAAGEDLPLPLDQTAGWLDGSTMPAEEYSRKLREGGTVPVKPGAAYPAPYASAYKELIRRLQNHSQLAADLLQLCAVFGPGPVPLALLRAVPRELVSPALASLLEDPTHFEITVGKLVQHSVVRREAEVLHLNRFVCDAVRRRRPEDRRKNDAQVVWRALRSARPGWPQEPATWPRYAELVAYLDLLWELESPKARDETRPLRRDCLTYLTLSGDYAAGLRLVDKDMDVTDWELTLCRTALLRATGDYARAERVDRALMRQLSDPGVVVVMNALSADLRGLGRYAEAYELCQRQARYPVVSQDGAYLRRQAALAASLRAVGQYGKALELDETVLARRREKLGSDHLETLASETDYAWDLLLMGRYAGALAHQSRSVERHHAAVGSDAPHTLLAKCALAVCRLKCGEAESGTAMLAVTLDRARRLLGEAAPLSLMIASYYSCALLRQRGRFDEATALDDFVTDAYRVTLGELHPYAIGASANQGLVLLKQQGDPDYARSVLEKALADMTAVLGEQHPWTLGIAVNTAAACHSLGAWTDACALSREAALRAEQTLGQRHPLTLAARLALAADLGEIKGGRDEAWTIKQAAIGALEAQLGPKHPQVLAAWQRNHYPLWNFEPLPI
ncbi:FxSxx-COOH system tetratricopeptide repeat protein [Streptomyces sp. NBS 14/10]|uniref:FxSxx-COOH system tetratricopeptide repeat protein n=1 Tax=Streptomyces sp. NBS 14/10 TaxID=1945643 RepID=UPI000B7DE7FF|nr:FxSxx-COOH system tetratricopeptide repeat protein [Streptomyces sp. NBS 14/10]KAK1182084.1 FxSxx-COOH system tetratricopeptide repeat protein [Streptomyces sp. NBS 14/10]NUS90624.1 tetratricopeptide repeat protein [Streptomyces sp.]